MVQLDARASVSIWQLVFFTPALVAATLLCLKHGFGRSSGWFFLLTVSLCRIAGGATQLATYSNSSQGLFTASAILGSFGLSALLLAALGFLSRVNDSSVDQSSVSDPALNPIFFRVVQLVTTVGLILSIVGDTNITLDTQTRTLTIPSETKAGIIILVLAWILVTFIAIMTAVQLNTRSLSYSQTAHHANRLLVFAVLVSLPFLLIRLIYSILTIFLTNNSNFNLIFPSAVTLWTLSTIEECAVVFIFLLVGFNVPKVTTATTTTASAGNIPIVDNTEAGRKPPTAYPGGMSAEPSTRTSGAQRWREGGIIFALGGMVYDLVQNKRGKGASRGQDQREGMMMRP